MIDALLESLALKEVRRTGWVRRGINDPESVAAHSWGMAWLVLVLLPPALNRERALTYALLHDLGEAWVGDIPPMDDIQDKPIREDAALEALMSRLARPDLLAAWRSYEQQDDPEARFVRELDGLDMALQARVYAAHGLDPSEFNRSAKAKICSPRLSQILSEASHLQKVHRVQFIAPKGSPLLPMALALTQHTYGEQLVLTGGGEADHPASPLVLKVLRELDVSPFSAAPSPHAADAPVYRIRLGPSSADGSADQHWPILPPGTGLELSQTAQLTRYRICRDALRRRISTLVPQTQSS